MGITLLAISLVFSGEERLGNGFPILHFLFFFSSSFFMEAGERQRRKDSVSLIMALVLKPFKK